MVGGSGCHEWDGPDVVRSLWNRISFTPESQQGYSWAKGHWKVHTQNLHIFKGMRLSYDGIDGMGRRHLLPDIYLLKQAPIAIKHVFTCNKAFY